MSLSYIANRNIDCYRCLESCVVTCNTVKMTHNKNKNGKHGYVMICVQGCLPQLHMK